jgi:hypothetical protein
LGAKRVHAVLKRRRFFLKIAAISLVLVGVSFFVKERKELLVREGSGFLQNLLSRETNLHVQIGKISGRLTGVVRFEEVRLEDPALPVGLRLLFSAKEIEVKYRLADFFTKKFDSKVRITVKDPVFYWRPRISLKRDRFGFYAWGREWFVAQRRHFSLQVKDLKLVYGEDNQEFPGIQGRLEDDSFELVVPLSHMDLMGQDVSTQWRVNGKFRLGALGAPDMLQGQIGTEGTVVNWSPLPWEAAFDYKLSGDAFEMSADNFLGGLRVFYSVDFDKDDEILLQVNAKQYALSHFEPFFGKGTRSSLEGRMDLDASFRGSWDALNLEAYARIMGGRTGSNRYKAMDLHVAGVYPTVKLTDSRILMEDGSTMRFADKTVEFKDLFSPALYSGLVSGEDQSTVVMGNWEFRRPVDENQRPEFMMQRNFGENAKMHITKYNGADEEKLDTPDSHDMEVGFEYRLKGKDSLKLEMREDERFVGVERKLNF